MSTATLASPVVGPALDRLVDRAGDLKGELIAYGLERRWDRARAAAFADAARGVHEQTAAWRRSTRTAWTPRSLAY